VGEGAGREALTVGEAIGTFLVVLVVFVGALFFWLPRLARRELFFAVTVPADFPASDRGQEILRGYGAAMVVVTILAAAIALWGTAASGLWLALAAPFVEIAGCFAAFLRARRRTLPFAVLPTPEREARLAPRHIRLPGGWLGQSAPFALLLATGIFLHANWARIPQRFPVHWDIHGHPNGWSVRTLAGVYGPLALGAFWAAVLLLLAWGILRWTRRVHATGTAAEADIARERRYLVLLLFTELFLAITTAWVALMPLRPAPELSPSSAVPLSLVGGLLIILVLLFVVYRPPEPIPAEGARPVGDRTEDRYWKAGIFYVNRNDPAVLIEKRFGIGYTVNWGHWLAWVILAGVVLVPVAFVLLGIRR
jgi:uncharacterized membrane protein